jgi:DNA end-binding protein Ku
VKIAPDMLTLAEHILKSKETKFDPSKFVDRYEQAVLQLLEKKQQGMPAPMAAPFVAPTNVVSLMDAFAAASPKMPRRLRRRRLRPRNRKRARSASPVR